MDGTVFDAGRIGSEWKYEAQKAFADLTPEREETWGRFFSFSYKEKKQVTILANASGVRNKYRIFNLDFNLSKEGWQWGRWAYYQATKRSIRFLEKLKKDLEDYLEKKKAVKNDPYDYTRSQRKEAEKRGSYTTKDGTQWTHLLVYFPEDDVRVGDPIDYETMMEEWKKGRISLLSSEESKKEKRNFKDYKDIHWQKMKTPEGKFVYYPVAKTDPAKEKQKELEKERLAQIKTLLEEKIPAVWAEPDLTRERTQGAAENLEAQLEIIKSWNNPWFESYIEELEQELEKFRTFSPSKLVEKEDKTEWIPLEEFGCEDDLDNYEIIGEPVDYKTMKKDFRKGAVLIMSWKKKPMKDFFDKKRYGALVDIPPTRDIYFQKGKCIKKGGCCIDSNDSYLILEGRFIYYPVVKSDPAQKQEKKSSEVLKDKKVADEKTIEVMGNTATILVWDSGAQDGDKVDIYVNEVRIEQNYELTKTKREIEVRLVKGKENRIEFVVTDEGKSKPCTVMTQIKETGERFSLRGKKEEILKVSIKKKQD